MQISAKTFRKFKEVISRVINSTRSDFYRKKFIAEGFDLERDLKELTDMVRVPRLTREELATTSPFERLYSDLKSVRYIRYTSGTSGAPMLLLFRPEQGYRIPGKRPLILAANNQLDHYFAAAPRVAQAPYFPPLIHSNQSLAVTAGLVRLYNVDAIVGLASKMIMLGKELPSKIRGGIQALFIQGERYTMSLSQELRTLYPEAEQDPRYGMTEVGLFGYQCEELRKQQAGQYHSESSYLLEISRPETGNWAEVGQEGEILVTELYESPHQIIRYRTGDAGCVTSTQECACGASFTFEVSGRIEHDIIKIAGGIIRTDEIERVIAELGQWLKPDFRGVVEMGEIADKILPAFTLSLIPKSGITHQPALVETVLQEIAKRLFMTTTKTLSDFLHEGKITRFNITFVEMFPPETKAQRLRFKECDASSPQ